MRGFFSGIVAIAMALGSAQNGVAAKEPQRILEPSSDWVMEYDDDSCRLSRTFGDGRDKVAFFLERYGPGDEFYLVAAGRPLKGNFKRTPTLRFGPGGSEYEGDKINLGTLGELAPALLVYNIVLLDEAKDEETPTGFELFSAGEFFGQKLTSAEESRIEWLEVQWGLARPVRLALGSMGPPLAAMRKCTDELLTHWGVDLEAHRHLSRPVTPLAEPGDWFDDGLYPPDLLEQNLEGFVQFRLDIDAEGKPRECHIQRATKPKGFEHAVCDRLMKVARFEPALDSLGKAIPSFFQSALHFRIISP